MDRESHSVLDLFVLHSEILLTDLLLGKELFLHPCKHNFDDDQLLYLIKHSCLFFNTLHDDTDDWSYLI